MTNPTKELQALINQFRDKRLTFEQFKQAAMLLVGEADLRDTSPATLLHYLALHNTNGVNDKEIIQILSRDKTLVDAPAVDNQTPLQWLLTQLNLIDPNEDIKRRALFLADHGANLEVCCTTGSSFTLLHWLVLHNYNGEEDVVIEKLLKANPNLINIKDFNGYTPLHHLLHASPTTSVKIVKKMIDEWGSDVSTVNKYGDTLLHSACRGGNMAVVQLLCESPLGKKLLQSTDNRGSTVLHASKNELIWQYLRAKNVSIDVQNIDGYTALHLAAINLNGDKMVWLCKNNANPNLRDKQGNRALFYVQMHKKDQDHAEEYLLKAGTQVDPKIKLFLSIKHMRQYGEKLIKEGALDKGTMVKQLAVELKQKATTFYKYPQDRIPFKDFKQQFTELLNSKNKEMCTYRVAWDTIIKNIAIALTGVGAVAILGKLIYSAFTEKRPLFFFQKNKTTSEEKVAEVAESLNKISPE